jgi:hypothetical protein
MMIARESIGAKDKKDENSFDKKEENPLSVYIFTYR